MKKSLVFYLITFFSFFVTNCSRSIDEDFISENIESSILSGSYILELNQISQFDWDTLYIFKPYTTVDEINENLGFEWKFAKRSGISYSDHFTLLLYTRNNTVIASVQLSKAIGSFGHSVRIKYPREEAIFKIKIRKSEDEKNINLIELIPYDSKE